MSDKPAWRVAIEQACKEGSGDLMVMPEWIAIAIQRWLDATESQPVKFSDFVAYAAAVIGHPIASASVWHEGEQLMVNEETITTAEILSWMPSSVSDAMSDLLADLKKGRENA